MAGILTRNATWDIAWMTGMDEHTVGFFGLTLLPGGQSLSYMCPIGVGISS